VTWLVIAILIVALCAGEGPRPPKQDDGVRLDDGVD
jgi:hypothetical protein